MPFCGIRFLREETRINISNGHKGIPNTPEQKAKISKFQKGRVKSKETREKLSISHKGKKLGPSKKRIALLLYDKNNNFIREYDSLIEASLDLNISHSSITAYIQGKIKNPRKWIWKIKEN